MWQRTSVSSISSTQHVSYWTVGARVSGSQINTPQTFKISYKAPNDATEQELEATKKDMNK